MKAIFFILYDADLLHPLLQELSDKGIHGATIFNSSGMGRELAKDNDVRITGILRDLLTPQLKSTKTLLFVIDEEKIALLQTVIHHVVGDLSKPQTGLLFGFPIDILEGRKL